ncbi:MAG: helix-turn-helix domain-containing protein [Chloroflexota bacterium]
MTLPPALKRFSEVFAEPPAAPVEPPAAAPPEIPAVEAVEETVETPAAEKPARLSWWARLRAAFFVRRARPEAETADTGVAEQAAPEPEAEPESLPANRSSGEIFAEAGAQLRQRRELLGLAHEEIERHIHIGRHYLKALEAGDFGGLPSAVQTRGMLSNYASFLDLDVDAILLKFADALQARHREVHPLPPGARGRVPPAAPRSLPPLRGFIAGDLVFGIGVIVLVVAFSLWGVARVLDARTRAQVEPTAPSISDVLLASPAVTEQTVAATVSLLDLGEATETPNPAGTPVGLPTLPEGITVQLNIAAVERTYLRVTVDGEVVFDGRVPPGSAYPFEAETYIEILVGNAAAVRVTYNQRDLGVLGSYGEIVNRIFTAEGIVTPTATVPPTPTNTLPATVTPTPSQTPTPTPNTGDE